MDLCAIAASRIYVEDRFYKPPCTAKFCPMAGTYDVPLIVGLWRWCGHTINVHGQGQLQQRWACVEFIDIKMVPGQKAQSDRECRGESGVGGIASWVLR